MALDQKGRTMKGMKGGVRRHKKKKGLQHWAAKHVKRDQTMTVRLVKRKVKQSAPMNHLS